MSRIVAMHSNGIFWAAKLVYDRKNVIDLLNQKFAHAHAAKCLISSGDMLALTGESPMRSSNSARARMIPDFAGLIAFMREANAHTLSIHDQHDKVMEMIGDWMMECNEDEDLFVENISEDRTWHHLFDSEIIQQISIAA